MRYDLSAEVEMRWILPSVKKALGKLSFCGKLFR
jgi:hypothetical protein